MDLTANVADFNLTPKQLQRHKKIMYIYDCFILNDTFLTKGILSWVFFMNLCLKMYNSLLLASVRNTDKYIFWLFCTWFLCLQFECHSSNLNSTFPLFSHTQMFPIVWFQFGVVFTYYFITGNEISFHLTAMK